MSIERPNSIYVSYEVKKALRLWAKATAEYTSEGKTIFTADELADTLLREIIKERKPQLFEFQKQMVKLEKEMLTTL